jgi:hypothetical protein
MFELKGLHHVNEETSQKNGILTCGVILKGTVYSNSKEMQIDSVKTGFL